MNYTKDFDEIFDDLLTAHLNKSGSGAGLLLRIFYSAVAVIAWGIYKFGTYVANQILPDTSDSQMLEKHAKVRGLSRLSGEIDAELLQRVSDDIQYPVAGGNVYDWPRWAKSVSYVHDEGLSTEWTETVKEARVHENARGQGTINVPITSDRTESGYEELASLELKAEVVAYFETVRPLGISDVEVYVAARKTTDVTIDITATDFAAVSQEVEDQLIAYMKSLLPGETLSLAMITATAIDAGAEDVSITAPTANVTTDYGPTSYRRIWPGTITIGEI